MRERAFSLVEAALAVGVLAFVLSGLLVLLPAGLSHFRAAIDTSVGAQIAQRVAGELQETDYFTLLASCSPDLSPYRESDTQVGVLPRRFFDDQGNEVSVKAPPALTPDERERVLYVVIARISRAPAVPLNRGSQVTRAGSRNMALVTIQVINAPNGLAIPLTEDFLVDPRARNLRVQTFPAIVSRSSPTVFP